MTESELIAQQALKIAELEEKLISIKTESEEIRGTLVSIGAPLNDNCLQYTHKQLVPFSQIMISNESILDTIDD